MVYEKDHNHYHDRDNVRSPHYPFDKPGHDSYGNHNCDCGRPPIPSRHPPYHYPCGPPQPQGNYPSAGSMMGNAFMMNNGVPYIWDNTLIQYGNFMNYSENVLTRVTQRRDPSCINLSATFDMTDSMNTNAMWCHFLEQTIINQYETLGGVLPIVKSGIIFKLYYDIRDIDGYVVHESHVKVISNDTRLHFTDIRDRFVTSNRDVIIANIPKMNYRGIYTITLNRIEAYVETIDTLAHIKNGMNQYYQFIDNNLKIAIQHDVIGKQVSDNLILVASCDILKSFEFHANTTTRLRISFVSFMSDLIIPPNTYGIWSALNDSRNAIIRDLSHEICVLKKEISEMCIERDEMRQDVNELIQDTISSREIIDQCRIDIDRMKEIIDNLSDSSIIMNSYTKQEVDRLLENKIDKDINIVQGTI